MSQAAGQAAGAAVGAAVGGVLGGPAGAFAGASIGAGGVGFLQQRSAGQTQGMLDSAALQLNAEQARTQAAERSAALARTFRKSLASQMALATMRGGAGSLAAQFGVESFQNYMEDRKAIESGLAVSESSTKIGEATNKAKANERDLRAVSNFASTAFSGVNFSNLLKSGGQGGGK